MRNKFVKICTFPNMALFVLYLTLCLLVHCDPIKLLIDFDSDSDRQAHVLLKKMPAEGFFYFRNRSTNSYNSYDIKSFFSIKCLLSQINNLKNKQFIPPGVSSIFCSTRRILQNVLNLSILQVRGSVRVNTQQLVTYERLRVVMLTHLIKIR